MTFGDLVPAQNPFDQKTPNLQPETIPLDEIIRQAMQDYGRTMRVCIPAMITVVEGEQKATVQLLLKTQYKDGQVVEIPQIQHVPVSMLIGTSYKIKVPISAGDLGFCLFCDRSLDIWLSGSGQSVNPGDIRAHDISDPIFVPGLLPYSNQTSDGTQDLVIEAKQAQFRVQPDGKFKVKNSQTELLQNLKQMADTLSTASTIMGGPFTADVVSQLQQIKSNIESLGG